jgi:RNA polymerase sigma factor (sigma-70 family)
MTGSVSAWIEQLKAGDEGALSKLYARYWPYLVKLARRKLKGLPRRATDEEDVAQQAFWGFYQTVRAGRVPKLTNRHQLIALLSHITACKAANEIKHEVGVQKRGGGHVRGESALEAPSAGQDGTSRGLEQIADNELSPQERIMLGDSYDHYVAALPEHLREFAELHLAGLTHQEIADQLGCTERTVDRKLALILAHWQRMAAASLSQVADGGS